MVIKIIVGQQQVTRNAIWLNQLWSKYLLVQRTQFSWCERHAAVVILGVHKGHFDHHKFGNDNDFVVDFVLFADLTGEGINRRLLFPVSRRITYRYLCIFSIFVCSSYHMCAIFHLKVADKAGTDVDRRPSIQMYQQE